MSSFNGNQCVSLMPTDGIKQDQLLLDQGVSNCAPKQRPPRRNPWGNSSYADLITQAIETSPGRKLTLSQIYDWMVHHVPYFKSLGTSNSSAGWKNSIRHNLSLHKKFLKLKNDSSNGKSSWWTVSKVSGTGRTCGRKYLHRRKKKNKTPSRQKTDILKKLLKNSPTNSTALQDNESVSTTFELTRNLGYNLSKLVSENSNKKWQPCLPNCKETLGSFSDDQTFENAYIHPGYDPIQPCQAYSKTYRLSNSNESIPNTFSTNSCQINDVISIDKHRDVANAYHPSEHNAYVKENHRGVPYTELKKDEYLSQNVSREYFRSPQHLSGSYLNLYRTSSFKADTIRYSSVEEGMHRFHQTSSNAKPCPSQNPLQQTFYRSIANPDIIRDYNIAENDILETNVFLHEKEFHLHDDFRQNIESNACNNESYFDAHLEQNRETKTEKNMADEINLYHWKNEYIDKTKHAYFETGEKSRMKAKSVHSIVIKQNLSQSNRKAFYFYDEIKLRYALFCENTSMHCLSMVQNVVNSKTSFFPVSVFFEHRNLKKETGAEESTYLCRIGFCDANFKAPDEVSTIGVSASDELSRFVEEEDLKIYYLMLVISNIILLRIQIMSNSRDFDDKILSRINQAAAELSHKEMLCYVTEYFILISNLYYSFLQKSSSLHLSPNYEDQCLFASGSLYDVIENYSNVLNTKHGSSLSQKLLSIATSAKAPFLPNVPEFLSSYAEDSDKLNSEIINSDTEKHLKILTIISLKTLIQICEADFTSCSDETIHKRTSSSNDSFKYSIEPSHVPIGDHKVELASSLTINNTGTEVQTIAGTPLRQYGLLPAQTQRFSGLYASEVNCFRKLMLENDRISSFTRKDELIKNRAHSSYQHTDSVKIKLSPPLSGKNFFSEIRVGESIDKSYYYNDCSFEHASKSSEEYTHTGKSNNFNKSQMLLNNTKEEPRDYKPEYPLADYVQNISVVKTKIKENKNKCNPRHYNRMGQLSQGLSLEDSSNLTQTQDFSDVLPHDLIDIRLTYDGSIFIEKYQDIGFVWGEYDPGFDIYL